MVEEEKGMGQKSRKRLKERERDGKSAIQGVQEIEIFITVVDVVIAMVVVAVVIMVFFIEERGYGA